jgi:hypothetical protein
MDSKIIKHAVDKLRYDDSSFPTAIFLHLNFESLNNDLLIDFAEAILYNTKLSFLAIILDPLTINKLNKKKYLYSMNPFMFKNLYKIFEAAKNNRNIKHLIFTSTLESKIILAPEISNIIVKKLVEDNLLSFHIGKILLTENFLKEVFSTLGTLKKLKYISFELGGLNNRLLDHLKSCIGKNRSLEIIGFSGFKISEEDMILLKSLMKKNINLKMLLNKEKIETI